MRTILHADMDAFYAAIEQRDRPELRGRPVIVGGLGRRGVVSTASYEARVFGVRSAMPTARARRLCPQGEYLVPRMAHYAEVSRQVFAIFGRYTPEIEALSLDEAFLDLSASLKLHGPARAIAAAIRASVRSELGLACSAGVAHNKFLAKLASELAKPDGCLEIAPEAVQDWLDPLPVSRLWTVGPVTLRNLQALGVRTVAELRDADASVLRERLGSHADLLLQLARGEDEREVASERSERSISAETTFEADLETLAQARSWLMRLTERVGERARAEALVPRRVGLKLRVPPFETMTRQCTLATPSNATPTVFDAVDTLLERWWRQRQRPRLRLLGVSLGQFLEPGVQNAGDLFAPSAARTDAVVDAINRRFGRASLRRAAGLVAPDED
jgi:DNA polymerase-4